MTFRAGVVWVGLVACGSSPPPPPPPPAAVAPAPVAHEAPAPAVSEQVRHDELAAAHHKLEEEQQEALAQTCTDADRTEKHPRCLPSCYPTEPPDPRAGKKLGGLVEVAHFVCEDASHADDAGPFVFADELEAGKLVVQPVKGKPLTPHKKGSWQAAVEAALVELKPKAPMIVSGAWRDVEHPLTHERLRCVTVLHYTKLARPLDGCGGDNAACEATGNPAARAINVIHYRLAEARRLQAAGKSTECQQAALEAVAVARGLPRWRQYVKLNINKWVDVPKYRTRFDGMLDEETLFTTAANLGTAAEQIYAACGGPAGAPTTPAHEQSFHTCW